jgi:hypothetical protein
LVVRPVRFHGAHASSTVRAMSDLSVHYAGLVSSLRPRLHPTLLSAALLEALADWYEAEHPDCALHEFEQSAATYLFDLASPAGLPQEDSTFAAPGNIPAAFEEVRATLEREGLLIAVAPSRRATPPASGARWTRRPRRRCRHSAPARMR